MGVWAMLAGGIVVWRGGDLRLQMFGALARVYGNHLFVVVSCFITDFGAKHHTQIETSFRDDMDCLKNERDLSWLRHCMG